MKSGLVTAAGIVAILFFTVAAAYRNDYGLTAPRDAPLSFGRIGAEPPSEPVTLTGTLVDAGCMDRSAENLARPSASLSQDAPAEPPEQQATENAERAKVGYAGRNVNPASTSITASGITVDQQTLDRERADIMSHQVPDLFARQPDMSCAITGDIKAFALLTDKGRLLNLDPGGNTWAFELVQSTDAGRSLLNGMGSSLKPHVAVKGQIWADELIVESISF
ncbi:MAG: hypothetical protein JOZ22_23700 [Acidobacteriia bacterium]|nr:hypothetical protein [Terriglobia bacterium]